MNQITRPLVIADPKAIEARRNGGKVQQKINMKELKSAQQGNNWRKENGLQPMKKECGFTLYEVIFIFVWLCGAIGVIAIFWHFVAKIW